jgi:hypothetical protein
MDTNENLRWACYQPPTADQLEKQQRIRDRIERLSVRPLRDSGLLDNTRHVRVGMGSGAVFCFVMTVLLVITWVLL